MHTVDEYFLKKTDKVSFVELKKGASFRIKDCLVGDDIPLPIVTETLITEIKEGDITEELQVAHIIEGIIYILGLDCNFKYNEQYKEILYNFNQNIEDYILYRGLLFYEEEQYDESAIFFRALININGNNVQGLFNYGLTLEQIANKYIDLGQENKGKEFLAEATRQFEKILDIDEKYPLAYYKLGYHYRYNGQYQKAKLIWEKYITLDTDELRVQEIREQLDMITDQVDYEEGINYLSRGDYEKALAKLSLLASKHKKAWNLHYMAGVACKGLGEYEEAVEYFCEAINLGGNEPDLYNELGICLFTIGNVREAIDIFSKGIEEYPADYKLIFNRGLMYLQLGYIEDAKKDISTAYKLNSEDPSIKDMVSKIKGI